MIHRNDAYIESFNGNFRVGRRNTHWFMRLTETRKKLATTRFGCGQAVKAAFTPNGGGVGGGEDRHHLQRRSGAKRLPRQAQ